ncbi:MAG: BrnA antitoxin family protein [Candidatus Poribacteria bacterium]|nr:BrnA antitoxin family protein [Candidatus Poribacteria bacterium]
MIFVFHYIEREDIMKFSKTRLSEIEGLPEEAIDTSEIPELDDDFWKNANRVVPENYLQIEHEILEWFKEQGQDYHTRINTVLRAYMETNR